MYAEVSFIYDFLFKNGINGGTALPAQQAAILGNPAAIIFLKDRIIIYFNLSAFYIKKLIIIIAQNSNFSSFFSLVFMFCAFFYLFLRALPVNEKLVNKASEQRSHNWPYNRYYKVPIKTVKYIRAVAYKHAENSNTIVVFFLKNFLFGYKYIYLGPKSRAGLRA